VGEAPKGTWILEILLALKHVSQAVIFTTPVSYYNGSKIDKIHQNLQILGLNKSSSFIGNNQSKTLF
jgi:hypothetical protein